MVYQRSRSFFWLFMLFLSVTAWGVPDQLPGVVVEKVAPGSETEKAGIGIGDMILSWARGDASGRIESPFDLSAIEIEQGPRGAVVLEGLRGTAKQVWTLGPSKWGLEARPEMPETLLSIYRQGQELATKGKFSEAAERWRMAAVEVGKSQSSVGVWLLSKTAELLTNAHQWQDADDLYQQSIQQAARTKPAIRVVLLRAWATTYEQRGDWRGAERHNQEALAESRKSEPDSLLTASCLFALGRMFWLRSEFDKAEELLGQSLEIRRKHAPGSLVVAAVLNNLGLVAQDRGNLDKADQYFSQALEIRQKQSPDSLEVAASFNNLGLLAEDRGDLAKAEQYHLLALAIKEKLAPASLDVAGTLSNLGTVAFERGDLTKAEGYMRQALEIRKRLAPDSLDVAVSLGNLGSVRWQRGDLAEAEEYYRETLEIEKKLAPGSPDTASTLDNLGNVASSQRDFPKARKYHSEALRIRKKLAPASLDIGHSFDNLGILAEEEGDLEGAARYFRQALEIQEKLAPNSLIVAVSLSNLGSVAGKRGDLARAEKYYVRALAIEQKLAPGSLDTSETLRRRGDVARDSRNLTLAEDLYRQALAIQEKLAPGSTQYAESLAALGSVMRRKGQLSDAAQFFDRSLNALENQITRLGGTEDIRSDFRARYARYYSQYIDLLMAQNRPELAFHIAERLRARSLLETLAAAHVDIHNGAEPDLLERERSLRESLNAKSNRRVLLLTTKHTEEQVEAVETEIDALRADYEQVESKIRASSPFYAALTQPQPLTAKEVQQLLDANTLLLEYSMGEERSYLWAVTSTTFTAHQLPNRSAIEATARRLYKLISALKYTGAPDGEARKQRQARLRMTAAAMSQMILAPIAEQLQGKRLLVIPDGALQYIPFALVPQPGRPGGAPLILEHEIVYSPSASVLAELRREAAGRKQSPRAVAVLADPVFDSEDPRVSTKVRNLSQAATKPRSGKMTPLLTQHVSRSVADVGLLDLPRLAFSRREADAIMKLTPAGQGLEALDFEASRSTATSGNLAQYRIVHFATHALSDNRHPELSGLVLSLVDPQGRPQNGFLDLQDIYNLNLPAELVVLSACETALGKEIQGEGLLSLTRGFMYAGATRVVASLWNVDDVSTKELMEKFYRAMEQEGMRPAAALRTAQVAMWKQHRWKDPYYWAAFEIQGEWN